MFYQFQFYDHFGILHTSGQKCLLFQRDKCVWNTLKQFFSFHWHYSIKSCFPCYQDFIQWSSMSFCNFSPIHGLPVCGGYWGQIQWTLLVKARVHAGWVASSLQDPYWWQWLPHKVPTAHQGQFWGSVSCSRILQHVAQFCPRGTWIRISDLPITGPPALPTYWLLVHIIYCSWQQLRWQFEHCCRTWNRASPLPTAVTFRFIFSSGSIWNNWTQMLAPRLLCSTWTSGHHSDRYLTPSKKVSFFILSEFWGTQS